MKVVELADFEGRVREILRQVAEQGETVEVADQGRVVARVVPAHGTAAACAVPEAVANQYWAGWEEVWRQVRGRWPAGVSAVDAVRQDRREL